MTEERLYEEHGCQSRDEPDLHGLIRSERRLDMHPFEQCTADANRALNLL